MLVTKEHYDKVTADLHPYVKFVGEHMAGKGSFVGVDTFVFETWSGYSDDCWEYMEFPEYEGPEWEGGRWGAEPSAAWDELNSALEKGDKSQVFSHRADLG